MHVLTRGIGVALTLSLFSTATPVLAQNKLVPADAMSGDVFGLVVDVDGDRLVVGAPLEDSGGDHAGAAYVYALLGTTWQLESKLVAADARPGDAFGSAVGLRGDTVVVGAPFDADMGQGSGSVYVFVRSGGTWSEVLELHASQPAPGDRFGSAVAVDQWLIVGAPRADRPEADSGSAYVFSGAGATWSEYVELNQVGLGNGQGKFHRFGEAVATHDQRVAVGAPGDTLAGTDAGLVSVFRRQGSSWVHELDLRPTALSAGDGFGRAIALSRNTLVVGAPGTGGFGPDAGAAFVAMRQGAAWSSLTELLPGSTGGGYAFGSAVDVDSGGILVGASGGPSTQAAGTGRAHLFVKQSGAFGEREVLLADDGASMDAFGAALGLSGGRVVVGAYGDDDAGPSSGAAYTFELTGLNPGTAFCFGDVSAGACPCGNDSPVARRGCVHSGGEGMSLRGEGTGRIAADDLRLFVEHLPPGNTGAFVVGNFGFEAGNALHDGLGCVAQDLRILRGEFQTSGSVESTGFMAQDPTGMIFRPGETVFFQYWTRDVMAGPSPCGFHVNTSPAYAVRLFP